MRGTQEPKARREELDDTTFLQLKGLKSQPALVGRLRIARKGGFAGMVDGDTGFTVLSMVLRNF